MTGLATHLGAARSHGARGTVGDQSGIPQGRPEKRFATEAHGKVEVFAHECTVTTTEQCYQVAANVEGASRRYGRRPATSINTDETHRNRPEEPRDREVTGDPGPPWLPKKKESYRDICP